MLFQKFVLENGKVQYSPNAESLETAGDFMNSWLRFSESSREGDLFTHNSWWKLSIFYGGH
jgi:hypothetical protein